LTDRQASVKGVNATAARGRWASQRGGWRPGDHPGERLFTSLFVDAPLALELGGSLRPITVAYETWGSLSPERNNAVLIEHALTGDSHAAGRTGPGHLSPGWWDPLIGPRAAIDTERWWVVCPNVLGGCQGTTGPSTDDPQGMPWGSRFPQITVRDQVAVEAALAAALGIERWAAVIGGSMGGMRALEWGVTHPEQVERVVVVACGAAATAEQIALCSVQAQVIRQDPGFHGGDYYKAEAATGPERGLGLARRIAHISYRSELEFDGRFGRSPQAGEDPHTNGRYAVESYLDHQADKLVRRFDANSYLVLSRAMDHHDVGRDRGGAAAALASITATATIVAVDSDRLYPPRLQYELASRLPNHPEVRLVRSPYGHDAFLIEAEQVGRFVNDALAGA
jgi:homoserine O-acetyltransferase